MLTKVEARTAQGNVLSFNLYEPSEGTILTEIEGLDPVKASIVSSKLAGVDGSQYRNSVRDERNIVLKFELVSDYVDNPVFAVRRRLYRFFMPKSYVTLWFYDDAGIEATISGRVESCEAPMFSQEPALNASILCFNPDFVDTSFETVSGSTVYSSLESTIDYEGTVPAGIEFTLFADRDISAFTIYNRPPDGTLRQLDFASPLLAGDVLRINTNQGQKKVQLTRAGVTSSVLYAISPKSNWVTLDYGLNKYRVYAEGEAVPFEIKYARRYGGL